MGNKLSELSKPTAWTWHAYGMQHATTEEDEHEELIADGVDTSPLYSQEYVSALLAELEAKDQAHRVHAARLISERGVLRERIAELEAIRSDASQVFKEIGNELGCKPDNESIMMAIDALKEREKRVVALAGGSAELWETMAARLEAAEAKLATPMVINLPERRDNSYDWDGAPPSEAFNTCRSICGLMFRQQLRAAGLAVGDE